MEKESIKELFDQKVEMIDMEDIERRSSPWGNTFATITKKQLSELKHGKVMFIDDGEYGHFIMLNEDRGN